jgi:hypothetical protein
LPINPDEVAAAIAASNATGRQPPLEAADAMRLLTAMFADADVCQRNLESLMAAGFSRGTLVRLLRVLIETGLVSKDRRGSRAPNTYHLILPPLVRR